MADHVRDVYRPIIERATQAGFFPLTLHVSGPLLEWLEQHDTAWLHMIGRLAAGGPRGVVAAGVGGPIPAALPRPGRRPAKRRQCGVPPTGRRGAGAAPCGAW